MTQRLRMRDLSATQSDGEWNTVKISKDAQLLRKGVRLALVEEDRCDVPTFAWPFKMRVDLSPNPVRAHRVIANQEHKVVTSSYCRQQFIEVGAGQQLRLISIDPVFAG